jgi:phage FluMu gp28-like protein
MNKFKNKTVLRPYQQRWVNDPARFAFAVKSAQIGYSTGTAAWAVARCLTIPKRTISFLSKSKPQARELGDKAKQWIDGYRGVLADYFPDEQRIFGDTEETQHRIEFPNGSRIIVLAANPDTARGYTGDVVLDEFGFHKDAAAIFTAVFRQTTLGYSMRVLSTPNGQQGKFYEMARSLGLDLGKRPRRQPTKSASGNWSGHWCDIFLACEEDFPVNPEEVRSACFEAGGDEETWLQEYCCQFLSTASQFISPELLQQNISSEASLEMPANLGPHSLCVGWDIARHRDLSVLWGVETVGDVDWTRLVDESLSKMPTPDQITHARALLKTGIVKRMYIDMSGMGIPIVETLQREFGPTVEGVTFTSAVKESMAVHAKQRLEEVKARIPDSDKVRMSFRSIKKTTDAAGKARFDAEHDKKFGHGDHWWAFCLAEAAAQQPVASLMSGYMAGIARSAEYEYERVLR